MDADFIQMRFKINKMRNLNAEYTGKDPTKPGNTVDLLWPSPKPRQ